jgi:N-methylhydantoinase B/oxoprolinase/acetone carboxylase alpha subunit
MENLIREVIELDKKYRTQVELLEAEKSKIGDFLRVEKAKLEKTYQQDAKAKLDAKKDEINIDLENRKAQLQIEYDVTLKRLEDNFNKNKAEWIETIYQFCTQE